MSFALFHSLDIALSENIIMKKPQVLFLGKSHFSLRDLKNLVEFCELVTIERIHTVNVIQHLQDRRPDAILLGFYLESGFDPLKLVRQIREFDNRVPIILLAERSTEDLVISALRAGIND